jgi:hypothetical protein
MIVAFISLRRFMKTLVSPKDAPRREPPNDPKKPPVKPPPRKRNPPVKEPPNPADLHDPPRRQPPIGEPPRPGRNKISSASAIRTVRKFRAQDRLAHSLRVTPISHEQRSKLGGRKNGEINLQGEGVQTLWIRWNL